MNWRYHAVIWLTAGFLTGLLFWSFYEAITRPIVPVESSHKAEEEMWPEIRPCQDELWKCIRQPMVRNDI